MKNLIFCFVALSLVACNKHKVQSKHNPLLGSWKMQSVTWISQEKSYPINPAQAGIFLFTDNSYSIQWTPTKEPRKSFVDLSKPTDKEKMAGFASVVFNSGSYEFTDKTVTTTAYIAKVPGFEGGKQYYNYTVNGNTLTITMIDEDYPDGSKPEWAGKWTTKFTLQRVTP